MFFLSVCDEHTNKLLFMFFLLSSLVQKNAKTHVSCFQISPLPSFASRVETLSFLFYLYPFPNPCCCFSPLLPSCCYFFLHLFFFFPLKSEISTNPTESILFPLLFFRFSCPMFHRFSSLVFHFNGYYFL